MRIPRSVVPAEPRVTVVLRPSLAEQVVPPLASAVQLRSSAVSERLVTPLVVQCRPQVELGRALRLAARLLLLAVSAVRPELAALHPSRVEQAALPRALAVQFR